MKNKNLILGTILFAGIAVLPACNTSLPEVTTDEATLAMSEKSGETETAYGDSLCTYTGVLTETDVAGIIEMREEEKLAHDVYVTFFEQNGRIIFNNISKSEAIHSAAVLRLINGYNLEDPALANVGEFSNPLFNELFVQLTEQGSAGIIEALKVGAFIEEYDINDLMNHIETTENADVARVYSNLLRGSKFHLKAFTRVLKVYGETYTPTVISEELYQEIIAGTVTEEEEGVDTDSDWTCPYGN